MNLDRYMILHGLKFSKSDHVFFIHVLYGLLTTKHVDTVTLETFAEVSLWYWPCQITYLIGTLVTKVFFSRYRIFSL